MSYHVVDERGNSLGLVRPMMQQMERQRGVANAIHRGHGLHRGLERRVPGAPAVTRGVPVDRDRRVTRQGRMRNVSEITPTRGTLAGVEMRRTMPMAAMPGMRVRYGHINTTPAIMPAHGGGAYQPMHDDQGLGFSLKPPKWIRKAKPGKILAKIAVPAAVIGASFLIPGVGGALVKGITSAGGMLFRGATAAGKAVVGAGGAVAKAAAPVIAPATKAVEVVAPGLIPPPIQALLPGGVPSGPGGSVDAPAGGGGGYSPTFGPQQDVYGPQQDAATTAAQRQDAAAGGANMMLPLAIGGGVLLLALAMNHRR